MIVFALTVAVFVMFYIGPYRNPGWLSPGFAIMFFLFGLGAVATGEFVREAVRKPFVSYNVVLSNQILPEEIATLRSRGYLEGGTWTKAWVAQQFPALISADGTIDERKFETLSNSEQNQLGETLFMYHCNDCHAPQEGYSGVSPMIRGWSHEMIQNVVEHPEQVHFFMPPWAGTTEEAHVLTEYLRTVTPPYPEGMNFGAAQ